MNSFHVLDVACGHGDLLRAIHRWARRNGKTVILEGIDLNTESAASATPADMNVIWRSGDVFAYRPQPRPDFIVSSQFAHHLDDFQLVKFLHWMDENANLSWYILDLQRHVLAYYGFKLLSWVARWHPVMRHDGAVSVSRGFTRAELAAAASDLEVTIRWHLPFRFGLEGRYDLP
jgi:trans-aconitate methyltransferase